MVLVHIGGGNSLGWLTVLYIGFSLGVMPAQKLTQTRPGARGALLFHACLPTSEFGSSWPADVPVQVHGMDTDPFFADDGDLVLANGKVEASGTHDELIAQSGRYSELFELQAAGYR